MHEEAVELLPAGAFVLKALLRLQTRRYFASELRVPPRAHLDLGRSLGLLAPRCKWPNDPASADLERILPVCCVHPEVVGFIEEAAWGGETAFHSAVVINKLVQLGSKAASLFAGLPKQPHSLQSLALLVFVVHWRLLRDVRLAGRVEIDRKRGVGAVLLLRLQLGPRQIEISALLLPAPNVGLARFVEEIARKFCRPSSHSLQTVCVAEVKIRMGPSLVDPGRISLARSR